MNTTNKKEEKPSYTESAEVASARAALAAAESAKPAEYVSAYGKKIEELADRIIAGEKFSYDFNADPIYNVYREQTERDRRRAVADAAASAAALTGGYANSYGATAAAEASAASYDSLRALIPSLVEAAYKKWYDGQALERERLSAVMALEDADYGRYRDTVSDYNKNRDYLYGKYSDLSSADYSRFLEALSQWNTDRDYERRVYEYDADAAYKAERAAAEDAMKQKEYELELAKTQAAIAASAAKAYSSTSTTTKSKEEKTTTAKSSPSALLSGITSSLGKKLINSITNGTAESGHGTTVRESFVDRVRNAKKKELISAKEYNAFMDYFRVVGVWED